MRGRRLFFALLRTTLALAVLGVCLAGWQAWWAWARYRTLPDYDYYAHAQQLERAGRLQQARLVADAGLQAHPQARRLRTLDQRLRAEQASWWHRAGAMAHGLVYGSGQNAWSLGAAVASDLFVFGDVRDLSVQGYRAVVHEPVDPWVAGLSALGLALTLAPPADAGAALLKVARKSGSLSADMTHGLVRLGRRALFSGDSGALEAVAADAGSLDRSLGTRPALRLMRDLESPAQLTRAARLVRSYPAGGRFALWLYGGRGVHWLARADDAEAGAALVAASRKGERGLAWLRRGGAAMLRPQPVIGLLKASLDGNLPAWLVRGLSGVRWLALPAAALWAALELWLLRRRWRRWRAIA